jgi:5-formyltetrahydrofolate cyclo-ligase
MPDKKELRKQYTVLRKLIHPDQLEQWSLEIANQFATMNLDQVHYLHIFYPIIGKQEINSLHIVNQIREEHPDITLVLPKSNLTDYSLQHVIWRAETPLAVNSWGITEPHSEEYIEAKKIDMILIPLLAYDQEGNRLGYGKGFYDRFLSECRPDAAKVGLSYFPPEDKVLPHNTFDIPLDSCVTPTKIWKF